MTKDNPMRTRSLFVGKKSLLDAWKNKNPTYHCHATFITLPMIQKRYWKLRNVITNASTNKLAQQRNIKFFTPSWSRSFCVWHMPSRASSLKTKQVFLEPERHKKEKKKRKKKSGAKPKCRLPKVRVVLRSADCHQPITAERVRKRMGQN